MAFMSFEAFLYARTNLHFLRLDELSQEKRGKYHKYTLGGEFKGKKLNFKCTALGKNLFDKNDEIILTNLKDNIILFRNFSKEVKSPCKNSGTGMENSGFTRRIMKKSEQSRAMRANIASPSPIYRALSR